MVRDRSRLVERDREVDGLVERQILDHVLAVVIEHHLDLLAEADYIVELGPVGSPDGGELMYQGELAGLLTTKRSPTAPYLRAKLKGNGSTE